MVICEENPKESMNQILELTHDFSKVAGLQDQHTNITVVRNISVKSETKF